MKKFIFTTFSQQILVDELLFAVTSKQKSNFSKKFKLKLVTIYKLRFVVKVETFFFFFLRFVDLLQSIIFYFHTSSIFCFKKLH